MCWNSAKRRHSGIAEAWVKSHNPRLFLDVGNIVLRDRQHLAEDGILIVVLALEGGSNQLVSGPDIVSRGFVYVRESDALMEEARNIIEDGVLNCLDRGISDWGKIKSVIKDSLGEFVWKKTKRRPMILPIIMDI